MDRLYQSSGYGFTQDERKIAYQEAYEKGKEFASGMLKRLRGKAA